MDVEGGGGGSLKVISSHTTCTHLQVSFGGFYYGFQFLSALFPGFAFDP